MVNTKLINLLKSLTEDEFKQCEKFIYSSYFNKGRDLIPFFKTLKPFYPEFDSINLNNEFIFKKIFPGKKYALLKSDNLIRTLSSHLFRLCKEFLIQLELNEEKNIKEYLLLSQLRKKKLYKEFEKDYNSVSEKKDDVFAGSARDFSFKYSLNAVLTECEIDKDNFKGAFESTVSSGEYSVVAALINSFKHEDMKNISLAYNINLRYNLMDNLLDNLDSDKLLENMKINNDRFYPYLHVFHMIYKMNRNKDNRNYYYELKDLLIKNRKIFGQSENYVLWNIMHTYCEMMNLGMEEVFKLFDYILKNNIHRKSEQEDFHIVLFRNVILCAVFLNKYEWLEKFIFKYSSEIHIFHRENMKNYSLAYLHFAKSEFDKSLEYISKIKYDLFMFKSDMKMLQLRIFYELGYYEQAYSAISATNNYLNYTKELAGLFKDYVGNFIKFIKELIILKSENNFTSGDIEFLEKKIRETQYVSFRDWLLEKTNELKK